MAEKIICDVEDLVAIADAVRASNGSAEVYNMPELSAAAVSAIGSGGVETCTVTVNNQISNSSLNIKYVSADLSEINDFFLAASSSESFITQKNNMIHIITGAYDPDATWSPYRIGCTIDGSCLHNFYTNGYAHALVPLENIVITVSPMSGPEK